MKKLKPYFLPAAFVLLLAGWAGRKHIRNLFPPAMKFSNNLLTTVDGQQPLRINDLRGSVVIVSCFQTWCMDCARETPVLNELAATIHSPAFKVVYITDEDEQKINGFRNRFASNNILFTRSATMKELGISVFPTTYLLNKKGEVVTVKFEGYDWLQQADKIRELLAL